MKTVFKKVHQNAGCDCTRPLPSAGAPRAAEAEGDELRKPPLMPAGLPSAAETAGDASALLCVMRHGERADCCFDSEGRGHDDEEECAESRAWLGAKKIGHFCMFL